MAKLTADQRAIKLLEDEGFSSKMVHVVQTVAGATQHRTVANWVKWFKKLDLDVKCDVELNIIELTFRFVYRKKRLT